MSSHDREKKAFIAGWNAGYYEGGEHDCRMFEPSAERDWNNYAYQPKQNFDQYLEKNNPTLRNELMGKITKKFYVGSRSMIDGSRSDWAKSTLQEAINHASELCSETDEEQIVVQIVRVIRPAKRPIVVEKV